MHIDRLRRLGKLLVSVTAALIMSSCTATFPPPGALVAPAPIMGNSGKYMSPYTSDGVLAPWVDKAINVKLGATIGKTAGAYAGQKALEMVPFVGGILGSKVGEAAGRAIAIEASGGWDYIKNTSDLSFNSPDDMAVFLYVTHSSHEHYKDALAATCEIYRDLCDRYDSAIQNATHR
jgi:hypothetical protein